MRRAARVDATQEAIVSALRAAGAYVWVIGLPVDLLVGYKGHTFCVEVKSGSDPVDRPTVDKLIGAGQKFGAETCLFVSWGGFKSNVQKELARDFFRVRLWSRKDLLEKLFAHYDRLPEEIRLALPLKRVWMVANQEES